MFLVYLSDPSPTPTVTDYLLIPLDSALQPFIDSVGIAGSQVSLSFSSVPGRTYRVQYKSDLGAPSWAATSLGDIPADTGETAASLPVGAAQSYFRVVLLP
jgi:hypothetical protein